MQDYRSTFVDTKKLNVNISKSKNKTEPALYWYITRLH